MIFGLAFVASFAYLTKHQQYNAIINTYKSLHDEVKYALSVLIICIVYFGGTMYMAAPVYAADILDTPASVDNNTTFLVPAKLPESDKDLFNDMFTQLKQDFVNDLPTVYEMPFEATDWVDKMIEYTVNGGKMNRGLAMMEAQKLLAKAAGRKLTNKERVQSAALGWCIEYLQAFFLVADDIMDGSVTRRSQPCWYKKPDVKLIAINDSFILESCVYKILKKYFGKETYYPQLVDMFIETTRQTELGQLMDLTSQPLEGPIDLNRFTIERYNSIVKYKTAFYSFYLPIALGMIVHGITDIKQYDNAREILLLMGEYFQVQDDFLDCYGTPEQIGKIGTDIQDNKCSWLVVQALNRASKEQRKTLEDNYGQHDDSKIQKIKQLYKQMGIEKIYLAYEEESYKKIMALLAKEKDTPPAVFEFLLNKIYKRQK